MRAKARIAGSLMIAVAAGLGLAATSQADRRPLKVFILAGQSNMEGHARIETFDYIGDDPTELAGFVWLQGWNDMVDGYTYPAHGKPGQLPVVLSQGDAGG